MNSHRHWLFAFCLSFALSASSQPASTITLSGTITNEQGEALPDCMVVLSTGQVVLTDHGGNFAFKLSPGTYQLEVQSLGYERHVQEVVVATHTALSVRLAMRTLELAEVSIYEKKFYESHMASSLSIIDPKRLKLEPLIFGEGDLIKKIQLLPGVKTIADGASGYFVRGGANDQNLILLDDMPIYQTSHLFGLVSVINPDVIKSARFHKTILPTSHEGRLSSVLEVAQRHGNMEKTEFGLGLGTLALRGYAGVPIVQGKSGAFLAVRKSTLDFFLNTDNGAFVPAFYDINLKARQRVSANGQLLLSGYLGSDHMATGQDIRQDIRNQALSAKVMQGLAPRLFVNVALSHSAFSNDITLKNGPQQEELATQLGTTKLKTELDYQPAAWWTAAKVGWLQVRYQLTPAFVSPVNPVRQSGTESGIYLWNEHRFAPKNRLEWGIRAYRFASDSTSFQGFTGSVSVTQGFGSGHSLSYGYSSAIQFVNQLASSAFAFSSLDYWSLSSSQLAPQQSESFLLEYALQKNHFKVSISPYFRLLRQQLDYVENAQLIGNPNVTSDIRQGDGRAYGMEWVGELTPHPKHQLELQYTWARVLLHIPGINNNSAYPALHDIPHSGRLLYTFKPGSRFSLSTTFVYESGRPATLPVGFYFYQGALVPMYSERNASRLKDYHRLDLSANVHFEPKKGKASSDLSFGIFNSYNRQNPLAYNFDQPKVRNAQSPEGFREASVFYSFGILPFIQYSIQIH